jgi:hypothetical protein
MPKRKSDSKRVASHFKETASTMPRLSHWPERSQPFDITKSEVVKWLKSQPKIDQWIFDKARNMGCIEFDAETETWSGIHSSKNPLA